jgi:uncharacterized protein (DUF433 family)
MRIFHQLKIMGLEVNPMTFTPTTEVIPFQVDVDGVVSSQYLGVRAGLAPAQAGNRKGLPLPFEKIHGVARVGGTRVTLDTVIAAFSDGATAEEIAQQYPSLNLADVYYVIGYYLRRPSEVEAHLRQRKALTEGV